MSIFSSIGNLLTGGLVDQIGSVIDKTSTSDEERAQLKNEAAKIANKYALKINDQLVSYEQELTKRLEADMQSDSWLSKNVRPLTLGFLIGSTVLLAYLTIFILDPERAALIKPWISLLTTLDITAISFYFGSRGVEKIKRGSGKKPAQKT